MRGVKIILDNGRKFALVARSGSHAIIYHSLPLDLRTPKDYISSSDYRWHPIHSSTNASPLESSDLTDGLCCLVRDPIERFRSACARQKVSVEEGLSLSESDVHFWSLEYMGLLSFGVKYFRFPDQIDLCAEWLGLPTPIPKMNEEPESDKPVLTETQRELIKKQYNQDILLWESLLSIG